MVENEDTAADKPAEETKADPAKTPAKRGTRTKAKEPEPEVTEEDLAAAQQQVTNWEFINRVPSPDNVMALLATLPTWWGVAPKDFADYVQALPSDKKIKVPERGPGGGTRKVDRWFNVVTLYFSVAGRIQMLNRAQELHGWRVEFEPEPTTPTGVPGFIDLGETSGRIIYREYVLILAPLAADRDELQDGQQVRWYDGQKFEVLGRKPGMAWVPHTGGSQAKGSNPYEKAETAARGRALAAWGFGVLPGSGVASLEEMLGVPTNRQGMAGETTDQPADNGGGQKRETPQELEAQIRQMAEEIRQLRGEPEGWNLSMLRQYAKDVQNVDVLDVDAGMEPDGMPAAIDLTKANAGTLLIMRNGLRKRLVQARDAQESGS